MNYPTYLVNISYQPMTVSGQTLSNSGGVTISVPTYTGGYYVASMPELKISATGDGYVTSLNSLMAIATASTTIDPGTPPYNTIKTW